MSPVLTDANREARRTRIGASEVGALLGWHPWTDAAHIYARIVDGAEPEQTSSMQIGHDLEAAIARIAADRLGLDIRACRHTYTGDHPPLAATPDYYARVGAFGPYDGLVEVKVSNEWAWWLDGPPPWIVDQVQTQMALSGRAWAYVAVLIGGRVETYRLASDPDRWALIRAAAGAFYRDHLYPHIPPATDDESLILHWTLKPGERVAGPEAESVGSAYMRAVLMRRWAEGEEKMARAAFVPVLTGSGTRVMVGSGWSAVVDDRGTLRFNVTRKGAAYGEGMTPGAPGPFTVDGLSPGLGGSGVQRTGRHK